MLTRKTWPQLQSLDVGSKLGFCPAQMPLLRDVFEALPAEMLVNVEIKCEAADDGGLSEAVGAFITHHKLAHRVLLSSFNPFCLVRLAKAFPQLKRGLLIDPDKAWAPQAWGWLPLVANASVHPHFSQCTEEQVKEWHALGLQVAVWTVDDITEAQRLETLGVEYLITNRPGALRKALRH